MLVVRLSRMVVSVVLVLAALSWSTPAQAQVGAGSFASAISYNTAGLGLAVFTGGSITQLEAAGQASSASGIWLQDASGAYQLLVIGGPVFLKAPIQAAFPNGLQTTAVTVVRAAAPTPAVTATPSPSTAAVVYPNCTAAKAAGVTPLYRGQPGYSTTLDRDGDGIACE